MDQATVTLKNIYCYVKIF